MKKLTISQSLRKEHRRLPIDESSFNKFKEALKKMLSNIRDGQREDTQLGFLKDFLRETFYPKNWMAKDGDIDQVIKTGEEEKSGTALLIEAKSTINKSEMITVGNLNGKALRELLYYYLHERELKGNISLKYMIVNNAYEFFIFDAHEFERKFYNNKSLLNKFHDFKDGRLAGNTTGFFYEEVASEYIAKAEENLEFTHFDLRSYEKYLEDDSKGKKKLEELYKIFSDVHLIKKPIRNDSNSLNKEFYNELLHIIGVQEKKVDNKPVIIRLPENERHAASLLENTIKQLSGIYYKKEKEWGAYGETQEERLFNVAMNLCITWINRILFLKLLEGQLLKYHNGDEKYKFLSFEKIKDYDDLKRLFFDVLAKKYSDRDEVDIEGFEEVPFLNSSLFEPTTLEETAVKISDLSQRKGLPIYKNSVLLKPKSKATAVEMNPLDYLFSFLDSYDFSGSSDSVRKEHKTLINASVLGLIFEKINGHKDGSVFTPGYITMYMCREAVSRAVIQKFNEHYGWDCNTLDEVEDNIEDRQEANRLINTIRLCDPSVGSGHFLVSALNEMIRVKYELGVLFDRNGKRLKTSEYNLTIENDELVLTDEDGMEFTYNPNITARRRIQEMLFHEKKTIIENCLFGVDLNPNSVKICSLRLWIELLKNTYYTEESGFKHLETLPNIDINIKCGNSLVHRFDLKASVKDILKNSGISIREYRQAVARYKSADKEEKAGLDLMIRNIKDSLRAEMGKADKRILLRQEKEMELKVMSSQLFEQTKAEKNRISLLEKEIKALNLQIEEIKSNKMYLNAFEWRIEFPELLDDDGNFMGFDCIVGNPPYIQLQKMGGDSKTLEKIGYQTYNKSGDICALFYELGVSLLKENGSLLYITTNTWMRTQYGENLRSFLLKNSCPDTLIDFLEYQVFDSVTVRVNMLFLQKKAYNGKSMVCAVDKGDFKLEEMGDYFSRNLSVYTFSPDESWAILSPIAREVKRKVEANGVPLSDWGVEIYRGILTGCNDVFVISGETKDAILASCLTEEERIRTAEIIRPILRGRDIKKYCCEFANQWLINTHNGVKDKGVSRINIDDYPSLKQYLDKHIEKITKRTDKGDTVYNLRNCAYMDNFSRPKIVYPNMTKFFPFYLDNEGFYTNQKCFVITGEKLGYLTAFFNSSLFRLCFKENFPGLQGESRELSKVYFEQIPIMVIDEITNEWFVEKVQQIQDLRKRGISSKDLEDLVDEAICRLYHFSDNELDLILQG